MQQDYIMKEISKFSQMLLRIATRLGLLDDSVTPPENVPESFSAELEENLGISPEELLGMDSPMEYLVSVKEFDPQDLETLATLLLKVWPDSEEVESFRKEVTGYLDSLGMYSFSLHSYEI